MIKLSGPQIQQYTRIALYHVGAAVMSTGYISSDKWSFISGLILNLVTLAWTIYGTRLTARINDLIGHDAVKTIVMNDTAIADSIPDKDVVAATDVEIVKK